MKILVTGFEPFGGRKINSGYEAVKLLPDTIAGAEIIRLLLPTSFFWCAAAVESGIRAYRPDAVICVGEAGGRERVTVERVAVNLADAAIPDNDGEQPSDEPLLTDGPAAYFATVPVRAMVDSVREHGIPCEISYSAGTFVCNCVMYHVLHIASVKYPNIRAGFIHVPYSIGQSSDSSSGLSLSEISKALEFAIGAVTGM